MTTPWDELAKGLTRLKDSQGSAPVTREATVSAVAPLSILFDTDTTPVLAYGTLQDSLVVGDRVLTLQLRNYVWVLGVKGGRPLPDRLSADAVNLGTVDLNTIWESGWYVQARNVDATTARNYPFSRAGFLEVIGSTEGDDFRMQRYTDYQFSGAMDKSVSVRTYYSGTWYPWRLVSGESIGWTNLSSYLSSGFSGTVYGKVTTDAVEISGAVSGTISAGAASTDFLNALPAAYRPSTRTRFGTAWRSGYSGSVILRTDGTGGLSQNTVNWTGAEFSICFLK